MTSNDTGAKLIGELLVEATLISPSQLEEALTVQRQQGGKVVETLISLGLLSAEKFTSFLARQGGAPSIDLARYEVPQDLIQLIPKEFAQEHEVFPVDKMGSLLTVAMVCPLDDASIKELNDHTGLRIKPMLCGGDEIRMAINRYYPSTEPVAMTRIGHAPRRSVEGLAAPLKLRSIVQTIRKITHLPALPETVEHVRRASADPTVSIQDVVAVIKRDPPMAAKLLSVANSAAYGFPNRVDSLDLAVSLMGLRETYSIVLATAVVNLFDKSKTFDYKAFWQKSAYCAAAALVVGPECGQKRKSALFSAGLLLGIGRAAMTEIAPKLYGKVSQELPLGELIVEEQRVVGIAHPEAGYELASNWNLPTEIIQAIRFYNRPNEAEEAHEFVAAVSVAYSMSHAESADDETVFVECQPAMEILGLGLDKAKTILPDYFEKRDSIDFLG